MGAQRHAREAPDRVAQIVEGTQIRALLSRSIETHVPITPPTTGFGRTCTVTSNAGPTTSEATSMAVVVAAGLVAAAVGTISQDATRATATAMASSTGRPR
ncbi:MAG: hypothetical protein U0838_06865 [Chloroflexota bacterium]